MSLQMSRCHTSHMVIILFNPHVVFGNFDQRRDFDPFDDFLFFMKTIMLSHRYTKKKFVTLVKNDQPTKNCLVSTGFMYLIMLYVRVLFGID